MISGCTMSRLRQLSQHTIINRAVGTGAAGIRPWSYHFLPEKNGGRYKHTSTCTCTCSSQFFLLDEPFRCCCCQREVAHGSTRTLRADFFPLAAPSVFTWLSTWLQAAEAGGHRLKVHVVSHATPHPRDLPWVGCGVRD